LSPKSTAWDQFGQSIAYALVGLATNKPFNFSHMIFDGMLSHINNGSPFFMYPRFVQLFLNIQLEDLPKSPSFIPAVLLPSKVFTFMAKKSVKFSWRNTPLTAHILEVAQAIIDEADSPSDTEHSGSNHTHSPAHESSQHTAPREGTVSLQSVAHDNSDQGVNPPPSPNDYTSIDESQTSGGDEGEMDNYALTRELRRLKKENDDLAAQLFKLKAKFKRMHRYVWPLVKHHRLWVKQQQQSGHHTKKVSKSKRKKLKKKSSFTLGRNLDNENLKKLPSEKVNP
jgi:hypothetical protein